MVSEGKAVGEFRCDCGQFQRRWIESDWPILCQSCRRSLHGKLVGITFRGFVSESELAAIADANGESP